MTLAELEAAISWMERNRLSEHLQLLKDDPRYAWTARQRGTWAPPVGRLDDSRSRRALGSDRERDKTDLNEEGRKLRSRK